MLESLEIRVVPALPYDFEPVMQYSATAIAVDIPGYGVWRREPPGSGQTLPSWQNPRDPTEETPAGSNTTADASIVASGGDGGGVVIPGYGIWRREDDPNWPVPPGREPFAFPADGNWYQLTSANPSLMVMRENGVVAAEFPGAGVCAFEDGPGWQQLTTADANLIAVDPFGNVAGNFPGRRRLGVSGRIPDPGYADGWVQLTTANANKLDMNGPGNVAIDITRAGSFMALRTASAGRTSPPPTQRRTSPSRPRGDWRPISKATASGTMRTFASGWHQITTADASQVYVDKDLDEGFEDTTHADPEDEQVVAMYPGYGLYIWQPDIAADPYYDTGLWQQIPGTPAYVSQFAYS